ncbi:MAG TPA: hypothetical protein VN541_20555, partial [Tepidisphaeraceae bacterium]|nr:hypothetical protein [Tepidisphaeraceae bacterium]
MIALLLAEALVFGLVFDAQALHSLPRGWWTAAIPAFPASLRIAALVAAAGMLLGGKRLWDAFESESRVWSVRPLAVWLVVHLFCVAGLFAISGKLFGVISSQTQRPGGWMVLWVVGCIACGATWLLAVLPGRAMGRLLFRFGGVIVAAALVGVIAWAAGEMTQAFWSPLRTLTLHAAYV